MHEQPGKMNSDEVIDKASAAPPPLLLRDLHQLVSLITSTARRKPKPTPALITMTQSETAVPIDIPQRRNNPVNAGRRSL